jgi:pimeloyl-ACP methyl ester carboxylesterase
LCLHGWQDNAGTFDTLIPLLSRKFSYLVIDLPGHGRSSHLPDGAVYSFMSYLDVIHHIKKEYNWKRISLMGHSVSSRIAFVYAALFPENVDMVIGLDNLKPIVLDSDKFSSLFKMWIQNYDIMSSRSNEHVPDYTIEEMVKRSIEGSQGSLKEHHALILLRRNLVPSNRTTGKFSFARDGRLKNSLFPSFSDEFSNHMAERILKNSVNYLFITGSDTPEFDSLDSVNDALEIMKKNPNFQYYTVETDSHHFHMTQSEKISNILNEFIEKSFITESLSHL